MVFAMEVRRILVNRGLLSQVIFDFLELFPFTVCVCVRVCALIKCVWFEFILRINTIDIR